MKKIFTINIFLIFLNLNNTYCQTDKPASNESEEYFSLHSYKTLDKPRFYKLGYALTSNEMHLQDSLKLKERRFIEEAVDPPAIGVVRDLNEPIRFTLRNIEIPTQGEIQTSGGRLSRIDKDTLVFTTYIRSENADEIRVFFSEGYFPLGTQVNLFSKDDYAFTQYDLTGNLDENGFYTTTTFADYIIIQVVIPIETNYESLHFVISKVTHVDNKYNILNKPVADCYEDANCNNANRFFYINNLRRATAQLTFPKNGGYYVCSGGLLNDIRNGDFQPFLLTANHCFSTQSSANGLEARFNYWSTSCNSGVVNQNFILVNGANLIKTNSQSDFTMVLLKENPGGSRTYLGWTTGVISDNAILHSVHHPNGSFQKYSRLQNKNSPAYNCLGTANFLYTNTLDGQITGGSSGGLIVNSSGLVLGQLFGGCSSGNFNDCIYNTFNKGWGKLSSSYLNNNLQYWLYGGGASVNMTTSPTSTLQFADIGVGSTENRSVTVTNNGSVPNYLNLEAGNATISGTNSNHFSIVGSNSLYLSPGRSGAFRIRFSPTSPGSKTATLNIPNNADNITGAKRITLTGCGVPAQPSAIAGFLLPSRNLLYTYTIPSVPGATSYTWSYTGNGAITPNGTTCNLVATTSGVLSVRANVSCGTGLPRTLSLTVVEGIRIYPNPISTQLTIEFGGNQQIISFEVYNTIGETILKGNFIGRTVLQTSHFAPGVYYIKLKVGDSIEVKKIIKM